MDVCVNIYRYLSGGLKTRRKDELQLESTWGAENKDKNIALIFGEKRLSRKSLHKENSHFMVCNILRQFLLKSTILFSQGNTDYKIALWKAWGIFMRSCSPQAENRSCEPRNEEKKKKSQLFTNFWDFWYILSWDSIGCSSRGGDVMGKQLTGADDGESTWIPGKDVETPSASTPSAIGHPKPPIIAQ